MTSPPKMVDLLKDPNYRKYFLTNPRFPYDLAVPRPWKTWMRRPSSKRPDRMVWASQRHDTFKNAWAHARANHHLWEDFSLSSMVIGFQPPKRIVNLYPTLDWCIRCRRPVEFRTFKRHHALDNDLHQWFSQWPICPFCGFSGDAGSMTVVRG